MNNYLLEKTKDNLTIFDAFAKMEQVLSNYHNILVSISGGADSDIMIDMFSQINNTNNVRFVFFDTGIEYQATKEHLSYLENRYNVKIERVKAAAPVPLGCRKYGLPFLSKAVSENIERLQKHNFDFKNDGDKRFEELFKKYPRCKAALKWWCDEKGNKSAFNISRNKLLKEFMIANPPTFQISQKCCKGAKKDTSKEYVKENKIDLICTGMRQAEGGVRSTTYSSCFTKKTKGVDQYRPIWWFTDEDKAEYENLFDIKHSACYTEYGLKRTGCAGCPFGSRFEEELAIIDAYEPRLSKAINNIFQESYEYTKSYRNFKILNGQPSLFDFNYTDESKE